jgi:hypothetical protein
MCNTTGASTLTIVATTIHRVYNLVDYILNVDHFILFGHDRGGFPHFELEEKKDT